MVFRVFLMHWYGVLQLCVLSHRTTLRFRVVRYLFLVGVLTSLPMAIALESLAKHYFPGSDRTLFNALIEESAKAAPVFYLLWCTRLGMSLSVLDGLVCGAAVGAGFGFGEDAIYMIENANIAYSPFTTLGSIVFQWLPGGWAWGGNWFPGHLALGALTGAGLAAGRRLIAARRWRWAPGLAALVWATMVHGAFDEGGNVAAHSLWGLVYYGLNGSGQYLSFYVLALLVAMLVVDELWVRKRVAASMPVPLRPFFGDVAAVIESLGRGWKAMQQTRGRLRIEEELVQLRWEVLRLSPGSQAIAEQRMEDLTAMLGTEGNAEPAARWTPWWKARTSRWWKAYRVATLPVMAYAFWLVFLSPYWPHVTTQTIARSNAALVLGLLGIVLMFWRFAYYLRNRKWRKETRGGSELAIQQCQAILMWSGFLTCLLMFKDLYDVGSLPYPFSAQVLDKYNQARSCLGNAGFDTGGGAATSPVHTIPDAKKDEQGGFTLIDDRP